MRMLIGIDPGANGAMCVMTVTGEVVMLLDFKLEGLRKYIEVLSNMDAANITAAIEKVGSMPGQGVKSMFSFGQRLGELEGMLQTLKIGYVLVPPKEWQKSCGVPTGSDKKGIHAVIQRIYPTAKLYGPKGGVLDGRCDALGITHYLRKTYGGSHV